MKYDRLTKIRQLFLEKRTLSCGELCSTFGVSVETVRRDLAVLEKEGVIRRVYGGAVLSDNSEAPNPMKPWDTRIGLNNTEKVITILKDRSGCIWLKTIYGKVLKRNRNGIFVPFTSSKDAQEVATLIYDKGNVKPILASATKPFPYPMYNYTDKNNTFWLTNNKGKELFFCLSASSISTRNLSS